MCERGSHVLSVSCGLRNVQSLLLGKLLITGKVDIHGCFSLLDLLFVEEISNSVPSVSCSPSHRTYFADPPIRSLARSPAKGANEGTAALGKDRREPVTALCQNQDHEICQADCPPGHPHCHCRPDQRCHHHQAPPDPDCHQAIPTKLRPHRFFGRLIVGRAGQQRRRQ